jgi:hypothetical protein
MEVRLLVLVGAQPAKLALDAAGTRRSHWPACPPHPGLPCRSRPQAPPRPGPSPQPRSTQAPFPPCQHHPPPGRSTHSQHVLGGGPGRRPPKLTIDEPPSGQAAGDKAMCQERCWDQRPPFPLTVLVVRLRLEPVTTTAARAVESPGAVTPPYATSLGRTGAPALVHSSFTT